MKRSKTMKFPFPKLSVKQLIRLTTEEYLNDLNKELYPYKGARKDTLRKMERKI